MAFHLDNLLNIPGVTVETCAYQNNEVYLTLRLLTEESSCPHCGTQTADIHQNRPILMRDLPVFGQPVYLRTPRRQFYLTD